MRLSVVVYPVWSKGDCSITNELMVTLVHANVPPRSVWKMESVCVKLEYDRTNTEFIVQVPDV